MLLKVLKGALGSEKSAEEYFTDGLEHYRGERYADALKAFERAIALDPARSDCLYQAGAAEYMLGNEKKAWQRCEEALARNPNFAPAHGLMAHIALPGPPYTAIIDRIHETLRPRTYLEIGVFRGDSIALVRPETRAVGIDPKPQIRKTLGPNVAIHAMTSDDYFAQRDVRSDFGGNPIDLAFIDGLHHFDVALRDFINVEKYCTAASTVLVHDWYPLDRVTAERDMRFEGAFYSGDVWRLALVLKKYRPDLKLATIATAPTGLGVIRGLDPASTVLEERYDEIVAEFMALDYSILDADKAATLNRVPNDWHRIAALLQDDAHARA